MIRRIITASAALAVALGMSLLMGAQPASASTVKGYGEGGLIITVTTGQKNTGNHTQYVNSILISDISGMICDRGDPTEAWAGNVWYQSERGCPRSIQFTIDRWVPSGSGVCGSYYRWKDFPGTFPWSPPRIQRFRFVACITISV